MIAPAFAASRIKPTRLFLNISFGIIVATALSLGGCDRTKAPPTQLEIDAYLASKVMAVENATYQKLKIDEWSRLINPVIEENVIRYTFQSRVNEARTGQRYFKNRIRKVREMHCDKSEDLRMMAAGVEFFYTVVTSDDVVLGTITANTAFCNTEQPNYE